MIANRIRPRLPRTVYFLLVLLFCSSSFASAEYATPVATPATASYDGPLPPAWVEYGPQGVLIARKLVAEACPVIEFDGLPAKMTGRTRPTAEFPVVACEAVVPFGSTTAVVSGQSLPLPRPPFDRIAVLGDAGCRINEWEKKYQACNDPTAWPFAQVARSIAAWQPDLIVHVGDYLYRESACPAGNEGCAGSPFGDNWITWNSDFFAPASAFLDSAPIVFMRGNHETCARNPDGWYSYLDPRPFQEQCQRYTEPYVVPMVGMTLAVIDSAEASDTTDSPEELDAYREQFALLAQIAPPGAWLVTHRPAHGILTDETGDIEVDNASYQAAAGGTLGGDYALILSGHIHLAQSLSFTSQSGRPPQLVAGNGGTALDEVPSGNPTARQLGDPAVESAETLSSFGFMTLERDGGSWIATQRDADGAAVVQCALEPPEIVCTNA